MFAYDLAPVELHRLVPRASAIMVAAVSPMSVRKMSPAAWPGWSTSVVKTGGAAGAAASPAAVTAWVVAWQVRVLPPPWVLLAAVLFARQGLVGLLARRSVKATP